MDLQMPLATSEPVRDCLLCPRLAVLRDSLRAEHPGWWNAPVPAWGDPQAWLAVVGLAPGKQGANRTGRPFTGDQAGDLLFATLAQFGLTTGTYAGHADDGLALKGAIILNAVKCLPPQNKPTPAEIAACRPFLREQLAALPRVRVVVALGRIAHDSFLTMRNLRKAEYPFSHGAQHTLPDGCWLIDSYHCSRYNTQTGRLTAAMFAQVFEAAQALRQISSAIRP